MRKVNPHKENRTMRPGENPEKAKPITECRVVYSEDYGKKRGVMTLKELITQKEIACTSPYTRDVSFWICSLIKHDCNQDVKGIYAIYGSRFHKEQMRDIK